MKITVFGSGYVGLVSGACLANLGHDVLCMDVDENKINKLKAGEIPFYEPGLKELAAENVKRNRLKFTTDAKEAVEHGIVILNCVGTPGKDDGSANLDFIFDVAKNIAKHINEYKVIVTKSTVPPGTNRKIHEIIKQQAPQAEFDVISNPEFLKEGAAIEDFNHPDRIVVGLEDPNSSAKAKKVIEEMYSGLSRTYIETIYTNWETAELIKYASNTFLAAKVSFINEIANICDKIGANVKVVAKAMGLDYRISPKFLNAGVGYGGSCFPKDVRALTHFAKQLNYEPKLINSIDIFNERQKTIIVDKIKKAFNNSLQNKTIAIFGLSFKPKTSDMRDAPSITIINSLLQLGAKIKAYDPAATDVHGNEAKKIFNNKITYPNNAYEAAQDADAIVLVTEWDEFRSLDMEKIKNSMKDNKLFDGRNIYVPEKMRAIGFEYYGIGQQ